MRGREITAGKRPSCCIGLGALLAGCIRPFTVRWRVPPVRRGAPLALTLTEREEISGSPLSRTLSKSGFSLATSCIASVMNCPRVPSAVIAYGVPAVLVRDEEPYDGLALVPVPSP